MVGFSKSSAFVAATTKSGSPAHTCNSQCSRRPGGVHLRRVVVQSARTVENDGEDASESGVLPRSYNEIFAQVKECLQSAMQDGLSLLEVQFPPIMTAGASAALNQTLDANRSHTREILRAFTAKYSGKVVVAFPDAGEAKIAKRAWSSTSVTDAPYRISTIAEGKKETGAAMTFVVNPGFNVDEYIDLEAYYRPDHVTVVINGDLDKIRGGYYPRLFYPKLHRVAERCLRQFEPVYYFKPMPNGGCLFRQYPDDWKLFFKPPDGPSARLLTSRTRPEYRDMERLVRIKSEEARLAGGK